MNWSNLRNFQEVFSSKKSKIQRIWFFKRQTITIETLYVEKNTRGWILDTNTCYWVEEGADGLNMLKLFSQPMGLWSDIITSLKDVPSGSAAKNLPCRRHRWHGLNPWVRKVLEEKMATHSSILAWGIPWTVEPGRLQSKGSQRVGHDWAIQHKWSKCVHYSWIHLKHTAQNQSHNFIYKISYECFIFIRRDFLKDIRIYFQKS